MPFLDKLQRVIDELGKSAFGEETWQSYLKPDIQDALTIVAYAYLATYFAFLLTGLSAKWHIATEVIHAIFIVVGFVTFLMRVARRHAGHVLQFLAWLKALLGGGSDDDDHGGPRGGAPSPAGMPPHQMGRHYHHAWNHQNPAVALGGGTAGTARSNMERPLTLPSLWHSSIDQHLREVLKMLFGALLGLGSHSMGAPLEIVMFAGAAGVVVASFVTDK